MDVVQVEIAPDTPADHDGGDAPDVVETRDFDTLLADYKAAFAQWDVLPENYTNEQAEAVAALADPLRDALFACPAPTSQALLSKMRVLHGLKGTPPDEYRVAVIRDASRLLDRRNSYGIFAGIDFQMCVRWSEWADAQRAALEGPYEAPEFQRHADDLALDVLRCRASNASELALKLGIAGARFFGARLSDDARDTPQPYFGDRPEAVIPAWVMKGIWEDVTALADKSEVRDRAQIAESKAIRVGSLANDVILAGLYGQTLVTAVRDRLEAEITPLYAHDIGLREGTREQLRGAVNDIDNLCDLIRQQVENAVKAATAIDEIDIWPREGV